MVSIVPDAVQNVAVARHECGFRGMPVSCTVMGGNMGQWFSRLDTE